MSDASVGPVSTRSGLNRRHLLQSVFQSWRIPTVVPQGIASVGPIRRKAAHEFTRILNASGKPYVLSNVTTAHL